MVIVYDLEGKPHEKEPVDARECISILKWSLEKPEAKKVKAKSRVR